MRDRVSVSPLRNKFFRLGAGVLLAAGVGVTALQTTSSFAQEASVDKVKFEIYVTNLDTVKSTLLVGDNGDAPDCHFLDDTADADYWLNPGTATVSAWTGTDCTGKKVSEFNFAVNRDCINDGLSIEVPNNVVKCFEANP